MISISNCPITGLQRKVEYDFFWYKKSRQIIIKCYVDYYKDGITVTENVTRLQPYVRNLIASDSLVNSATGVLMTQEQIDQYTTDTATLNVYNTALQLYNAAIPVYNSAMTQYNTNFAAYQIAVTVYDAAMIEYQAAITAYNEAMLLEPPNPENLELPIASPTPPIVPLQPLAPVAPIAPNPMPEPGPAPMQEYDFYTYVLGVQPLILPQLIENIILLRDTEGKFNI